MMEYQNQRMRATMIMMLMFVLVAAVVGTLVGYIVWGPGAGNYSLMSKSDEATRTVTFNSVSVTFPSVIVCELKQATTRDVLLNNVADAPRYVTLSLNLVRNDGVDSTTISSLTGNPYKITLAAYATSIYVLNIDPSSKGYAIFDLRINGELLGSIALYVVS